jgi:WD40 repeat protein/tRNA A-37 threonylcarbamoyl transferase component Bud32
MARRESLDASLPSEVLEQIDAACRRFEQAWQNRQRPRLEDHLGDVPDEYQSALLRELLAREVRYRRGAGETPEPVDYAERFPGQGKLITLVFAASSADSQLQSGPPILSTTTDGAPPRPDSTLSRPPLPQRYELKRLLGQGGMGDIWLGRDRRLRRPVAVKVMQDRWIGHPAVVGRFVEEAQLTSQLQHPAIPPVYERGELPDGRPWFCLKVVRGRTLASLLAKRADPGEELPRYLAIFEAVCQAVAYAHSKGVIHRDLKPSNIMVGAFGEVQVMDWGLAKVVRGAGSQRDSEADEASVAGSVVETDRTEQAEQLTQAGAVLGTYAYMPPEQARGEVAQLDKRSDVFGLGAILCEILTGAPPYTGGSREEVRTQSLLGFTQPALDRLGACAAEEELTALARSCLSGRAEDRPADAAEVAAKVGAYLVAVQERLRRAEVERAATAAREEEAKATAAARAREEEARATAAAERRARRLSVALVVVLLLGIGAALGFGIVAVRQAADARDERGKAEQARQVAETEKANADEERGKAEAASQRAEQARRVAETEKANADEERGKAEAASQRAEAEHDRAERLLYARQLALAQREWEANNAAAAWQHLEATRWDLRGWEYRHLYTLFNSNQHTLRRQTSIVPRGEFSVARVAFSVTRVAFSPDGRRIATGSWDRTVRVWDTHKGQEVLSLTGHTGPVLSVAFSPDGRRIASASIDGTVKVWDAHQGQEVLSLEGHTGPVKSVAVSSDGQRIATASVDRTVKVWDAHKGQLLLSLKGHTDSVTGVAFSPDDRRLASASGDRTVRVWDAHTGQQLLSLTGHMSTVESVAFSPDGQRLASASQDRTVQVWDAHNGQWLLSYKGHTHPVTSVAFSPDGQRLASASSDQTVKLWDAHTGQLLFSLTGHTDFVTGVAFSPESQRIASAGRDGTVKVWAAHNGQQVLSLTGHTSAVESVAFSPDGQRLASASQDQTVKVWDAHKGRLLLSLTGHTGWVRSMAFSPDGRRIASGARTVKVWDAHKAQLLLSLPMDLGAVESVAFSPDGQRIASASSDGMVKVWDARNGQRILSLTRQPGSVRSVAFSPDGQRLATAGGDRTVKVWDAHKGHQVLSLTGHTIGATSVAFSPDGGRIATAGYDGTVKVWDAQNGHEIHSLTGHTGLVSSVAFSPDGQRIATAGGDRTVKVWDTWKGQEVLSLTGHTDRVLSVAFSPDGKRLASASYDRTLKVWDAHQDQLVRSLNGHTRLVTSVAFSPDGQQVLAQDESHEILAWNTTTGRLLPNPPAAMPGAARKAISPNGRLHASIDPRNGMTVLIRRRTAGGQVIDDSRLPAPGFYDFDPDRHLRLADEAEDAGHLFAAAFHVGLLLRHRPHDASLHIRQAHLLATQGRREQSAIHLLHALFLHPRVPLVPLDPRAATRGEQAARAGDWTRAARAFERAAWQPEASGRLLVAALLAHTAAGDEAARRRLATDLAHRLEIEEDPNLRTTLLERALEEPSDRESVRVLLACASADLERQRTATTLHHQGAALFRAGRYVEAARVLAESVQAHGQVGYVDTWLFQAMTARRLDRHEQARELLKRVEQWHAGQTFPDWQSRVRWAALLKEARQVVEGPPLMPRLSERE